MRKRGENSLCQKAYDKLNAILKHMEGSRGANTPIQQELQMFGRWLSTIDQCAHLCTLVRTFFSSSVVILITEVIHLSSFPPPTRNNSRVDLTGWNRLVRG